LISDTTVLSYVLAQNLSQAVKSLSAVASYWTKQREGVSAFLTKEVAHGVASNFASSQLISVIGMQLKSLSNFTDLMATLQASAQLDADLKCPNVEDMFTGTLGTLFVEHAYGYLKKNGVCTFVEFAKNAPMLSILMARNQLNTKAIYGFVPKKTRSPYPAFLTAGDGEAANQKVATIIHRERTSVPKRTSAELNGAAVASTKQFLATMPHSKERSLRSISSKQNPGTSPQAIVFAAPGKAVVQFVAPQTSVVMHALGCESNLSMLLNIKSPAGFFVPTDIPISFSDQESIRTEK
jgi:hypothetical protein